MNKNSYFQTFEASAISRKNFDPHIEQIHFLACGQGQTLLQIHQLWDSLDR